MLHQSRLTATIISIAVPEQEPCLDPKELPIQQQPPLLTNSQTPYIMSNQQAKYSGGNDDYLTVFREMIADELQGSSGTGEIAEPQDTEGLDPTEVISQDLLETAVGWDTPVEDTSCDSIFQPTCPSLTQRNMEISNSDDQDLPYESITQLDDGQRSQGSQDSRMDEEGNTDIPEPEDIEMQSCLDARQNENFRNDASHHQAVIGKLYVDASGRAKGRNATKSTRLSLSRKGKSVTRQRSGLDPMRAAQKHTGPIQAKSQNITKLGSYNRTSGVGPVLEKEMAYLQGYMMQNRMRYERLGLPCPGDFVDNKETKNRLASLRLDNHANILRIFSFTIAGYESLVGLKEILRAYRDPDVRPPRIAQEVSNAKRLETIQCLGGKEAYLNLLKKCHIHRLFADNIDPLCNSNDNFIVSTAMSVAGRARGGLGNPRNFAESRITKAMMKDVYPEVHPDSAGYSKKYREIKGLRRSGRRLDLLVSQFGKGILGLLPLAKDDSSTGLACKVTDTMHVHSLFIFQLD